MTSVVKVLSPVILWALQQFVKSQEMKESQLKNYYEFLESIDEHTKADVTNYVEAGSAREETIKRILERRKKLGIDKKGKKIGSPK